MTTDFKKHIVTCFTVMFCVWVFCAYMTKSEIAKIKYQTKVENNG